MVRQRKINPPVEAVLPGPSSLVSILPYPEDNPEDNPEDILGTFSRWLSLPVKGVYHLCPHPKSLFQLGRETVKCSASRLPIWEMGWGMRAGNDDRLSPVNALSVGAASQWRLM